tara:strand:+ start:160 stop:432 length:273 start_codon:yes stop_codon:yes gene_type:complete
MGNKYRIVRGKTGKSKKIIVAGVKKVLYLKEGSRKLYVISKGRMMNLTKYKKMKKMAMKSPKKSSSKRLTSSKKRRIVRKRRGGGSLMDF